MKLQESETVPPPEDDIIDEKEEAGEVANEPEDTDYEEEPAPFSRLCCCHSINIVCLSLLVLCDFLIAFTAGPFIADLMVDFSIVSDKAEAGFFTGFVSLFPALAQSVSSLWYCWLAGKIGTRPILIVCQIMNCTIAFLLAFTNNYYYYLILRTVLGLTVGSFPVALAAMSHRNMPEKWTVGGLSVLNMFANSSFAIGAMLGGFLGRPVQQYPKLFEEGAALEVIGSFLTTFPLLFVYVAVGTFDLFVLVFVLIFMEENVDEVRYPVVSILRDKAREIAKAKLEVAEAAEDAARIAAGGNARGKISRFFKRFFSSQMFTKWPMLVLTTYVLSRAATMLSSFTIPVLLSYEEKDGGFGFTNYEVGIYGWVDGAFAIMVALLTPLCLRHLDAVIMLRISPFIFIFAVIFYPEVRYLSEMGPGALWGGLIAITAFRQFLRQFMFTIILLLMHTSVSSTAKTTLQGVSGFAGYVGAAIGPYLGNTLLGVGALVGVFPLDTHFCLILGCACLFAVGVVAFFLPRMLSCEREDDSALAEGVEKMVELEKKAKGGLSVRQLSRVFSEAALTGSTSELEIDAKPWGSGELYGESPASPEEGEEGRDGEWERWGKEAKL